jgi:hypothetical protein
MGKYIRTRIGVVWAIFKHLFLEGAPLKEDDKLVIERIQLPICKKGDERFWYHFYGKYQERKL